jgi:hypothetical protein
VPELFKELNDQPGGVDAKRLPKDTGYIPFFFIVKKMAFGLKVL